MKKSTKVWLIIATSLVLLGAILFGSVMTMLKWDFTKLSTSKYETNEHAITESFSAIAIDTNTADVELVPAEDGKCTVVCYELTKVKHSVTVKDGTLSIAVVDTRNWYEHIGIQFGTPKVTVYLPAGQYGALSVKGHTGDVEIAEPFRFESMNIDQTTGDVSCRAVAEGTVKIRTSTGQIRLENAVAASLDLEVTTGKVTVAGAACTGNLSLKVSTGKAVLSDVRCHDLTTVGDTGDLTLSNVIAAGKMTVTRSTGDVHFEGADAAEIFVKTDTGDVKGRLLTEKVFAVHTDTGRKEFPNTGAGGRCEITTDTGNVSISVGE